MQVISHSDLRISFQAEDFRGKKAQKGRARKEQVSASTDTADIETAQNGQKGDSPSASYPPGPAVLSAEVSRLNLDSGEQQDIATENEQSAATESLPSAGGESQGPVQALNLPGSPLREQNRSPRPSQGPQCVAASESRRAGRRGNGGRAKGGNTENRSADSGEGMAEPSVQTTAESNTTVSKKPVYDDPIRQFLRLIYLQSILQV